MRPIRFFAFLCTAATLASTAAAAPQWAFATNYRQDLMQIDMTSSVAVPIANIGFAARGLAQTSSGKLYATSNGGGLIDITGGVVVPVAPLGALAIGALDSRGTTLWGYDNTSQRMFEYDPGSLSFVQWSPVLGIPNLQAMAIDANGDFLFVNNGASTDQFGKVTKSGWTVNVINTNMGLFDHCEAIDFTANGKLYAAVLQDWRYEIDPLTGSAISGFWSGIHRDWSDMSGPVPVPEPATLVVIGLAALKLRRKK
ncbi:MAG: PEP-CTERM sorting domain-containing protein [Armatimonadetes bacterium]|nr:PEP-CTERM sorting domain-containing protein [Armatimonadota bacterium]